MSARLFRLAAIATAAGAFSGLFGVGSGVLFVPAFGVHAGVALANAVSERTLELSFAAVQLIFAW
jgi:uncharacterized membrane protein YfcA